MMLATQIANELSRRWNELNLMAESDRLHTIETIVERHLLATSHCPSDHFAANYEDHCVFVGSQARGAEEGR